MIGEFFGSIYCMFEDFFGEPLAQYLWGQSSPNQTGNMYIGIGLTMFFISLLVCVSFYYIVNHPKLANWWGWSIFLVVNSIINFFVGWQWVLKDYYERMMVEKDEKTGELVPSQIFESDILAFGVSNMIISIITFIILSYLIKWWSTNVSRAPF